MYYHTYGVKCPTQYNRNVFSTTMNNVVCLQTAIVMLHMVRSLCYIWSRSKTCTGTAKTYAVYFSVDSL